MDRLHVNHARPGVHLALIVLLALASTSWWIASAQESFKGTRSTRVVSLLDEDKAVFGLIANFGTVGNTYNDAVGHSRDNNIDFVLYDMEHSPWDVNAMRTYAQFLLDPGQIAREGNLRSVKTLIVRIPAYGRELDHNTWMVKQVLDSGAQGVIFPHTETPEQALTAVRAMQYPQRADAAFDGIRGFAGPASERFWGLSLPDYLKKAGIWRFSPEGELTPWFIIENRLGVDNVREIAKMLHDKHIGGILWAGTGDMGASYLGDQKLVDAGVDKILAAGKEFGIPVAMNGSANAKQRYAQGARVFIGGATPAARADVGR
jgi:4-hydroxy-2-oxoheptanedioate aldolase